MANMQGASISTHEQSTSLEDRILNRYEYDAFGNTVYCKEKVHNRFQYTGQQYDPITQQYYLRARYYNPVIARFTQEDTYHGDGLNLYSYCHNNPLMYYDPSGHNSVICEQKYNDLRSKNPDELTADEQAMIDAYEETHGIKTPDYIRDNRVPLDKETVLKNKDYKKTGMKVKGAQVYKKGDCYYYRDTFHTGEAAHLEVFDKRGRHIGEADPLTGELRPNTADPTKKINVK